MRAVRMMELLDQMRQRGRKVSLAGVDMPEPIDSDKSGIEPEESCREVSGRELSAADINAAVHYIPEFVDRLV